MKTYTAEEINDEVLDLCQCEFEEDIETVLEGCKYCREEFILKSDLLKWIDDYNNKPIGNFIDDLKSFLSQSSSNSDRDIATAKTSYARINQTSTSGRSIEKEDDNSNSDHDTCICGHNIMNHHEHPNTIYLFCGENLCSCCSFKPRGKR